MSRAYAGLRLVDNDSMSSSTDYAMKVKDSQGNYFKILDVGKQMLDEKYMKNIILDCDNFVNPPGTWGPTRCWLEELFGINKALGRKSREALRDFGAIEKSASLGESVYHLSGIMRSCGVTKEQHVEASKRASKDFELKKRYAQSIEGLREIAYDPWFNTASFYEIIYESRDRLMIKDMSKVRSSQMLFDRSDVFAGMIPNLGAARARNRDEIMLDSVSAKNGVEIVADDNLNSIRPLLPMADHGWTHYYYTLAKTEPMKDSIVVYMPELLEDAYPIVPRVYQIDIFAGTVLTSNEDRHRRAVGLAHLIDGKMEKMEKSKGGLLDDRISDLLHDFNEYLRDTEPMFPKDSSNIEVLMEELRLETGLYRRMRKLEELHSRFAERSRELKLPRSLGTSSPLVS